MDRLLEMQTFCTVVEAGSFVAASENLGMSKAAVSRYVSELETRLGVRLLQRTTRRLSLTGARCFMSDAGSCWPVLKRQKRKLPPAMMSQEAR